MNAQPFSQPFSIRVPLPPGAPSFAGHRRLRNLLATLGGTTTNSVSVIGPRSSGRSTLLQQLSHAEYLSPPTLKDAVVVQASFRSFRGKPQEALQHIIQCMAQALQHRNLPAQGVEAAGSMVIAVKRALEIVPGRLILAIDDFEAVGSDLKKDHQSDLRQAVYHQPRAGYVVASRLPLTRYLQEWGDNLSDLAPLLNPMPELLEPLNRRELQEMIVRAVGFDPESRQPELITRFAHERVGGFALWVQQALAILVQEELMHAPGLEMDAAQCESLEEMMLQRLQQDLNTSYRRLSPGAQRVLEQPGEPTERNTLDELRTAGWAHPEIRREFKPAGSLLEVWLRERRWEQEAPSAPRREHEEDAYDSLIRAVETLNKHYQRVTKQPKRRIIRTDVFGSTNDAPFLRRTVLTEDDLGRLVLSLSRLLYEGTGGTTGEPRQLPEACYQNPDCIVRQVMTLRNRWVHLSHPNEERSERDIQEETAIYVRYIGTQTPRTSEDFRRLAEALRQETIRFIGELVTVCPFGDELKVETLFKKSSAA
jgi:hypothetical protein